MIRLVIRKSLVIVLALGMLTATASEMKADSLSADNEPSGRRWQVGVIYRKGIKLSIAGDSYSHFLIGPDVSSHRRQSRPLPSKPALPGSNPDDIAQFGDRDFDDGFVHTDWWTEYDGWTVNWGYEGADQYDPVGHTLSFQRKSRLGAISSDEGSRLERQARTVEEPGLMHPTGLDAAGLLFEYSTPVIERSGTITEFSTGVRFYPSIGQSFSGTSLQRSFSEQHHESRETLLVVDAVTDTYVYRTLDPPPPPPYNGSEADPDWDPLIENLPLSTGRETVRSTYIHRQENLLNAQNWTAYNRIDFDLEARLWQFAAGPRFNFRSQSRVVVHAGIAMLLNYIETTVTRRESWIDTKNDPNGEWRHAWYDRLTQSDWLPGGQVTMGVDCLLGNAWSAGFSAGYEWIERTTVNIGPSRMRLDLSGATLAAFLGTRF